MMVTVSAESSSVQSSDGHERDDHGSHESLEHLDGEHVDHDDHDHHDEHLHGDHDKSASNMLRALAITALSGCAALVGYCFIFCLNRDQTSMIPVSLGFSGGVILYLTFMNLIPEGVEQFHHATGEQSAGMAHFYNVLCIIGGIAMSLAMELIVPHDHGHLHPAVSAEPQVDDLEMCERCEELNSPQNTRFGNGQPSPKSKDPKEEQTMLTRAELPRVSYSVAIALILHHLPEGMAVFLSLYHDFEFGILMAIALGIHDLPSGVCIALPIYLATGSKVTPFWLCLLAALAYVLGGLLGWAIIISATDRFVGSFIGVMFGMTSGIMLYVALVEILPTAIVTASRTQEGHNGHRHRGKSGVYVATIVSMFLGILVMELGNIMLAESGGHSH